MPTHRRVVAGKPDLIIKIKKKQQYLIIDVAISSVSNVTERTRENAEVEKFAKGNPSYVEPECQSNSIIIGAFGHFVTNNIMKEVQGKHNLLTL